MSNGKNNEKDTLDLRVKKDLPKESVALSDEKLDGVAGGINADDLTSEESKILRTGKCPSCNSNLVSYGAMLKCGHCGRFYPVSKKELSLLP